MLLKARAPAFRNLFDLGLLAVQKRLLPLARALLGKAIQLKPRDPMALTYLGAALLLSQRDRQALLHLNRALTLQPDNLIALNIHACALGNLNRHKAAIASCDRALAINPAYVEALINRGNALAQLNRPIDALHSYERVLEIRPDFAEVIVNCGNVLKLLRRFDEALARYDQALAINPDYAVAAFNRGVTLGELVRPREAIKAYRRAIALYPNYVEAHYNLSMAQLQAGQFAQGWKNYEWRWRESLQLRHQREFRQPLWLGREPLNGKTILLHAEAGLGDTLQFCRYAATVAARGASVLLQVQEPLVRLLRGMPGVDRVLAPGARLPAFDYQCPLMSLPLALNTQQHSIPAKIPYVRAARQQVARWRARAGTDMRTRIGIVWSGNPSHRNDAQRSVPLQTLAPILDTRHAWFSLQPSIRAQDAAFLTHTKVIRHFGEALKDFSDTAALLECMDLVISVDTSVAHLAGAMGKPVWVLLPFNPDWRWMLKRRDSPWYPTARLFRQPVPGDWQGVAASVKAALARNFKFRGALKMNET